MSHDMFTASDGKLDREVLSWKELEIRRWRDKAVECKCRAGLDLRLCRLTEDACCYANCPFKYWGGDV